MNKLKKFWQDYKVEIVLGAVVVGGITLTVLAARSYSKFDISKYGMKSLPTVINEGEKKLYQLGGPNSPLRYELTEAIATAYNRMGHVIEGTKTRLLIGDDSDMAAWNYVAAMTNDYIAKHGTIPNELVTDHYLSLA